METKRKIIQIKGANASGKTTIVKQLIALEPEPILLTDRLIQKGKPWATILPTRKWAIAGHYPIEAKGGGADLIHTVDELKFILAKLIFDYPDYDIVFEGVMVSTTMTMYRWMQDYNWLEPVIVMLMSDLDGAIRRLSERKGIQVTADMFTQLKPKVERMVTQIKAHKPEHIRYIYVDTIAKDDMVYEFLAAVDWSPNNGQT